MSLRRYRDGGKECVGRRTLKKCRNAHCNAAAHRPQPRTTRRWECVCAFAFARARVRLSKHAWSAERRWHTMLHHPGSPWRRQPVPRRCLRDEGFTDSPPSYQHNKTLIHVLQEEFKEEKYRDCRVKGSNRARLLAPNVVWLADRMPL